MNDRDSSLGVRIARELARARGEDVESMPPVGNVVDAEALERFVENSSTDLAVTMDLYGHAVTVDGDGNVAVSDDG